MSVERPSWSQRLHPHARVHRLQDHSSRSAVQHPAPNPKPHQSINQSTHPKPQPTSQCNASYQISDAAAAHPAAQACAAERLERLERFRLCEREAPNRPRGSPAAIEAPHPQRFAPPEPKAQPVANSPTHPPTEDLCLIRWLNRWGRATAGRSNCVASKLVGPGVPAQPTRRLRSPPNSSQPPVTNSLLPPQPLPLPSSRRSFSCPYPPWPWVDRTLDPGPRVVGGGSEIDREGRGDGRRVCGWLAAVRRLRVGVGVAAAAPAID